MIDKFTRVATLPAHHTDLIQRVSILRNELLAIGNSKEKFESVLDHKGQWLVRSYRDGAGIIELMDQLFPRHYLALQVSFLILSFFFSFPISSFVCFKSSNLASTLISGASLLDRFCEKKRSIIE